MNTTQTETRFNGKCGCGSKFSALVTEFYGQLGPVPAMADRSKEFRAAGQSFAAYANDSYRLLYTCVCGKAKLAHPVLGKVNRSKECNGLCMAATGHSCECQCGGKNHGASHGA